MQLVGGLAGGCFRILHLSWFFPQQSLQFSPGLINDGCRELAGRLLPFLGQLFHPHIQQGNIFFKPAQRSPHLGNPEVMSHD